MKRIPIVSLIIEDDGKVLVERRYVHGKIGGGGSVTLHTFPAGHVEDDETHEEALIREMGEELGIALKNIEQVFAAPVDVDDTLMHITWFIARAYDGIVENVEGQELVWLTHEEVERRMHPISVQAFRATRSISVE